MTLVGAFWVDKLPTVIGDILLSGQTDVAVEVPTKESIREVFPLGSGWAPTRLRQKLAIVGNDLIIGWTGRYFAARVAIKELVEIFETKGLTLETIERHFAKLRNSGFYSQEGFAGFFRDKHGMHSVAVNHTELVTKAHGKACLLGSGVADFTTILSGPPDRLQVDNPLISREQKALMQAISLVGTLLASEINSNGSLLNFYGGGYEIAFPTDAGFRKFSDITYLFFNPVFDQELFGEKFQMRLRHVCRYAYEDDVLIVRASRMFRPFPLENEPGHSPSIDIVPPIYRDLDALEIQRLSTVSPSFSTTMYCLFFLTPGSANGKADAFAVPLVDPEKKRIRITEGERNRLSVWIDHEWLNKTIDIGLEYVRSANEA